MPYQFPTCSSLNQNISKHKQINNQMKVYINIKNIQQRIIDVSQKHQKITKTFISLPCFLPTFVFNNYLFLFKNQQLFLLFISLFIIFSPLQIEAQSNGKCYSFAPGLTILGADYRRDFGLTRRQCADVCKTDVCCMAFEWQRLGGQCTLKSRSLNGTVVNLANKNGGNNEENEDNGGNDLLFALCLDYGDTERDRFWDHEIGGPIVDSKINIEREECSKICSEFSKIKKRKINFDKYEENKLKEEEEKEEELNQFKLKEYNSLFNTKNIKRRIKQPIINKENKKEQQQQQQFPAVIYNWRPVDQNDMESPLGECQCISVLQNIKLNFGSFSGFLI